MGYIYILTNKINSKKYVGQTIQNDINMRWKQYKKIDKNSIGRCLYNAIIKYGIKNFIFQIICICFDEDSNKYEKEYIKKFNTIAPYGYNLMEGGENSKHHPETIELIRSKLKGRRTCPITDEIRKKLSESLKGEKNPNYGKKMSDEQKKKISNTLIANHKMSNTLIANNKMSDETKKKCIKYLKLGSEANRKKVGKYDNNNNLLEEFDCVSEASNITKISRQGISKVCNNIKPYKTAGGFIWKFI
jgi:hypothetical protein